MDDHHVSFLLIHVRHVNTTVQLVVTTAKDYVKKMQRDSTSQAPPPSEGLTYERARESAIGLVGLGSPRHTQQTKSRTQSYVSEPPPSTYRESEYRSEYRDSYRELEPENEH